ncbi:MAG: hypothetical protein KDI37_02485, partial [Xanthomonadales bacterium]|nr:hypothetical protein [Xanthomonadales bacterium]
MVSTEAPIRAGLIFQQAERAQQLKQSLRDAGIDLTLELDVQGLRNQGLEDDRVEVYIVNLESEIEDMLDEVTELLDATDRPVVYNDADVSSDLSGWDQARWARHLAAKIRKERGTLPPTPAGAESIPAPKLRATTPVVAPGLASPSTASDPATSSELAVEAAAVSSSSLAASLLALDAEAPPEARESAPAEPASEEQPPTLELPVDLLTDPMIEASTDSPPPDLGWALEDVPTESDEPAPVFEMDEVVPEAPASITPDASLTEGLDLDFQTDSESPEPGLATDGAIADEFESDFLDSAVDDLPDTDEPTDGDTLVIGESLDLSLDLPVDADALDLGDGSLEPVDALDDLSMFGPADEGSDLLEAIDDLEATPAGEVDELDSLFGDIDDASTESSELLDDESMDLPQALLAGELGELEAPGEDAKTEAQEEIAPDLDALFDGAIESDGTASMDEPAKGNSATERSPGLSLPDISQWVLEPLDEEPNEMDALGSGIEPVSTGLDLRGLDSNTPVAPAPAPPTPAVATPAPNEASAPVANLDLDLGLDFSDMDLAPELESEAQSPPVAAAPAAASLSAA